MMLENKSTCSVEALSITTGKQYTSKLYTTATLFALENEATTFEMGCGIMENTIGKCI